MTKGPPDEYRHRWQRRAYYSAIEQFQPVISQCDPDCVLNHLSDHIGIWHARLGGDYNFVGFKGSRSREFSIEIKIDPDVAEMAALKARGWTVQPWNTVSGYRVHLPLHLTRAEFEQLAGLVRRAYPDWSRRRRDRGQAIAPRAAVLLGLR
jgi:hypothetical protein